MPVPYSISYNDPMLRFIVILLILLTLLGCNKPGTRSTATGPAVLPAGWPVAELTLPGDAIQHPLPYTREKPLPGDMYGLENVYPAKGGSCVETPEAGITSSGWELGFASAITWSQLIDTIEPKLLDTGFIKVKAKDSDPASSPHSYRAYLSADRKTIVRINHSELELDDGSGISVAFEYSILEMPIPMPQDKLDKLLSEG